MILAVYPGCPTRTRQLSQLLDIQSELEPRIQFRVLPMTSSAGAPANCLVANPKDQSGLVLLFGTTPNFGISTPDQTHLNLVFRADQLLSEAWIPWFDCKWEQAAPLNRATVRIPPLVPVAGSKSAADQWRDYCELCTPPKPRISVTTPAGNLNAPRQSGRTSSVSGGTFNSSNMDDQLPSELIMSYKHDPIADRIRYLLEKGKQIMVAQTTSIAPFEVPINPRHFDQDSEHREGSIIHRQSFRVSAFSKKELQTINQYRKATQTIISKLGLALETGVHWMPDKVIEVFRREAQNKEKEAQEFLNELVGRETRGFLESKRKHIEDGLKRTYNRIGRHGDLPPDALEDVMCKLKQRIDSALGSTILAKVTYSDVKYDLQETQDNLEARWAQVERLLLSLARFPRTVIARSNTLSGLKTDRGEIMKAMNVAGDKTLNSEENWIDALDRSARDLELLRDISESDITHQIKCEVYFMIIDGESTEKVNTIVEKFRSLRPTSGADTV